MCHLRRITDVLFGFALILVVHGKSAAEPILLVEMYSTGMRTLTSGQPEMDFEFGLGIPRTSWQVFATQAQVGQTFSAPSELLSMYDQYLTSPELVLVNMTCCSDTANTFGTPPTLNVGSTGEETFIRVTRIAPNLGPNLVGYYLTGVTQTIDNITITPVPGSGGLFNRSGAHTVRIYGEFIPEPSSSVLGILILLGWSSLGVRLPSS
jgi:hypothetical protein